jgi:hypothetical protein
MGDDGTGKTRLGHSDDWVHIEIETALKKNVPVIPASVRWLSLVPQATKAASPGQANLTTRVTDVRFWHLADIRVRRGRVRF